VVLTLLLTCGLIGRQSSRAALLEPERPIASITLTVGEEARDEWIERLKVLVETNGFGARIAHPMNDRRYYFIEFWRWDIHITVANPFDDKRYFSVFLYQTSSVPVPAARVEALVSEIQSTATALQGITVDTVKK
jgi:hypothetical protein